MSEILAPSTIRTIGLVIFMVGYCCIGAAVFMYLERGLEIKIADSVRNTIEDFIENNTCLDAIELSRFMVEILAANDRGITVMANVTSQPNWSFGQSFFFAGTVLTTIGYGHVAPLSEGGKAFCIVYALVGIPLTLIMFTALVERNMLIIRSLLKCLVERIGPHVRTFYIRFVHLMIVSSILLTFIFFIPASIFMYIEKSWSFFDAFYYCFISMTTTGLGDYIPGEGKTQDYRTIYKVFTTFYLFIGITLMLTLLASIYDVQELNIGFHFYLKSDEDNNERMRLRGQDKDIPRYSGENGHDVSPENRSIMTAHTDVTAANSIQSLENQDTR